MGVRPSLNALGPDAEIYLVHADEEGGEVPFTGSTSSGTCSDSGRAVGATTEVQRLGILHGSLATGTMSTPMRAMPSSCRMLRPRADNAYQPLIFSTPGSQTKHWGLHGSWGVALSLGRAFPEGLSYPRCRSAYCACGSTCPSMLSLHRPCQPWRSL